MVDFVDVFATGGLDNPFDLTYGPDGNLYVSSNLTGEVLRFRGTGELRVVPARVLGPLIAFALSLSTLRALWAARG